MEIPDALDAAAAALGIIASGLAMQDCFFKKAFHQRKLHSLVHIEMRGAARGIASQH